MPILSIGNNVISSLADRRRGGDSAADHVRGAVKPPRLAVTILPADAREPRAGLRQRLRARYDHVCVGPGIDGIGDDIARE